MKKMRFIHGVFAMMLMLVGDSCFARGMAGDAAQAEKITLADGVVNGFEAPYAVAELTINADGSKRILAVAPTGKHFTLQIQ